MQDCRGILPQAAALASKALCCCLRVAKQHTLLQLQVQNRLDARSMFSASQDLRSVANLAVLAKLHRHIARQITGSLLAATMLPVISAVRCARAPASSSSHPQTVTSCSLRKRQCTATRERSVACPCTGAEQQTVCLATGQGCLQHIQHTICAVCYASAHACMRARVSSHLELV